MKWLFYSLDINSIEYFWFFLKEHVYKVNLNINDVIDDEDKIKKILFGALYKTWETLNDNYLHDLV